MQPIHIYRCPKEFKTEAEEGKEPEIKPCLVTGEIHLRKPSLPERLKYQREMNFKSSSREPGAPVNETQDKYDRLIRGLELAIPHIVKVDLQHTVAGVKIQSVEELLTEGDCELVVYELVGLLMGGFKVSGN